jgi:hypothetical protein
VRRLAFLSVCLLLAACNSDEGSKPASGPDPLIDGGTKAFDAFIGVNSNDNYSDARKFLTEEPVPYKHFKDPNLEIAAKFNAVQSFPTTAFYDTKGELAYVHQGPYTSENDLAEDIDRYAR